MIAAASVAVILLRPEYSQAEMRLIPSIAISEYYTSNVWNMPEEFVPGVTLWDIGTIVSPAVTITNSSDLVQGTLKTTVNATRFVNNTALGYIGTSSELSLNLTRLTRRFIPRTTFSISDYVAYTPEPPAFIAPLTSATAASNPFLLGMQAFRTWSLTNVLSTSGSYAATETLNFGATYTYSRIRFGNPVGPLPPGILLGTDFHSATIGPTIQLSPRDTLQFDYLYSFIYYGFFPAEFTTHSTNLGYIRQLSPHVTGTIKGGVAAVDPPGELSYVGNASIEWVLSPTQKSTVRYSRAVAPSIVIQPAPLLTQTVNIAFDQKLSERLTVIGSVNYGYGESVGGGGDFSYQSYGTSAILSYAISAIVTASLTYSYSSFDYRTTGQAPFAFDAHNINFRLFAAWY